MSVCKGKLKALFSMLLVSVTVLPIAASAFIACGEEADSHAHTYAEEWTKTATVHYKKATCEHVGERGEEGAHVYGTGDKAGECTICGYINVPEHVHTFEVDFVRTQTGHYKKATCEHKEVMGEAGTHAWGTGEKKDECTVCGYVRKKTEETEVWVSSVSLDFDVDHAVVGGTAKAFSHVDVKHDSDDPDYAVAEEWLDVTYESSDNTVATVSASGEIRAHKAGRTSITVKSKKTPKVKATKVFDVVKSHVFEAESDNVRLVGYGEGAVVENDGVGYVKVARSQRVQADKYNAKYDNSQVIFGMIAQESCVVPEIVLTYASPYTADTEQPSAAKLNELGDLFINGERAELPSTPLRASVKGDDEVFTAVSVKGNFSLVRGTNRIVWEARNKTDNDYEYLGAIDKIEVLTSCDLSAYKVMWWTDRNVYYDVAGGEAVNICVDKHYVDAQSDQEIDIVNEFGIDWSATDGMWGYKPKRGAARNIIKRSHYSEGEYANVLAYGAHSDNKGLWGDYDGEKFYLVYYLQDKYEKVYDFVGITVKKISAPEAYGGRVA